MFFCKCVLVCNEVAGAGLQHLLRVGDLLSTVDLIRKWHVNANAGKTQHMFIRFCVRGKPEKSFLLLV